MEHKVERDWDKRCLGTFLKKLESKESFDLSLVKLGLEEGHVGKSEDGCISFAREDEYGDWSLKLAFITVAFGNVEVAKFLSGFNLALARKNLLGKSILEIAASLDATETVAALLSLPWPEAKPQGARSVHAAALSVVDVESNTVLMQATRHNNINYVTFLLTYGASTLHVNDKGERAIDIAISCNFYDCAIILLRHESPLPTLYPSLVIASEELSSILTSRKQLHEFIRIGNLEGIQDLVINWELKVVPNENGESALLSCIKHKKYELFSFLHLNGLRFKNDEEANQVTEYDRNKIKESNKLLAWEVKDAHIISILSKCSSRQNVEFSKDIEECLRDLNSILEISPILKALRYSQHVTICFDFENDTLGSLAFCSEAKGWFLPKEYELLMGALELRTDRRSFLGTFIHELTHWAMQALYKNRGRPYPADHPARAEEYDQVVHDIAICTNLNPIIKGVFKEYKGNKWHSELIVRVPEMMANLGVERAVEELSSQRPTQALLSYYRNYVLQDLKAFVLEGNSIKSRETIANLNNEIGTLKVYLESVIHFKHEVLTRYSTELFDSSSPMVVVTSSYPSLAFLKVSGALNLVHFGDKFIGNILFCEFSELQKHGSEIVSTFYYLNECKYIVLLCADVTNKEYYASLLTLLARYVREKPEKKVILIVNKCLTQLTRRELKVLPPETILYWNEDGLTLVDLTAKSQDDILSTELIFQRSKTQLRNVLNEDGFHLVDGVVIERVMQSWAIVMEKERSSVNDYPPGFVSIYQNISVDRLLEIIDDCCSASNVTQVGAGDSSVTLLIIEGELKSYPTGLREKLCDLFEVNDLSEKVTNYEEITSESMPTPIMLFTSGSNIDYSLLFSNIHRIYRFNSAYSIKVKTRLKLYCDLLYSPNFFIPRQLTESLENPQSLRGTSKMSGTKDQNEFIDFLKGTEHCLHIISESAGMGKSRFLNFVNDNLISDYRSIKIPLKDARTSLEDLPHSTLDIDDVMNFICSEAGIDDEFSSKLLQSQLLEKSKYPVFLFFDAMDEIPAGEGCTAEANQMKVVRLIDFLKNDTHAKLLVVTRPEAEAHLDHLSSSSVIHFAPISLDACRNYLSKICLARMYLYCIDEKHCANVVESCINKYISNLKCDFLGNPLHISMLAEVMFAEIQTITRTSIGFETLREYSIAKLYGEFLEIKYRVCFKDKRNIPVDNRTKKRCEYIFQTVAFYYLHYGMRFSETYLVNNELFSKAESGALYYNYEEVAECFDIGIITSASTSSGVTSWKDHRIDFIHRTFAEYYAAKLFISWLVNHNVVLVQNLMEGIIIDMGSLLHCNEMFDDMLASTEISKETICAIGQWLDSLNPFQVVSCMNRFITINHKNTIQLVLRCLNDVHKSTMFTNPLMYLGCPIDYQYPLLTAARLNFHGVTKVLLQEGFSPNFTVSDDDPSTNDSLMKYKPNFYPSPPVYGDEHGQGVMHEIAKNGEMEMIKFIVKDWGGKLDVQTSKGSTLIHFAAASGKIQLIHYLEGQGLDVFEANKNKFTALHFAVKHGRLEMAQWLSRRGLNIMDCVNGDTLMHIAAKNFHPHLVEWLLDEGISPNIFNYQGITPLIALTSRPITRENAFLYRLWNNETRRALDCIEVLCRNGADPNIKDAAGGTSVHYVAYYCVLDGLILLEKYNGDLLARTNDGSSLMHFAVTGSSLKNMDILPLLKWLASRGCNVDDKRNSDGCTPIHVALDIMDRTLLRMQETLVWLLDQSKNLNATDSNGRGYLHYASPSNVQLLILKGCNFKIHDNAGRTAAHRAIDEDLLSVFKVLFKIMLDSNQDMSEEFIVYIKATNRVPLLPKYEEVIEWIIDVTSKNMNDRNSSKT